MKRKIIDNIATILLWICGAIILSILLWFLIRIFLQGYKVLDWHFITARPSEMDAGGGIGPEIFNTFYILLMSMVIVIPVGFGAGIYLAEFSQENWVTKLLRLCVECLASVPSIVFGLFGMLIFAVRLGWGFSLIGGAATLAILNLPVVVRVTEEAIRAIPFSYREASYALGATKWQTLRNVVLPAATANLITGINLAIGRAVGESAVLIFTAGTSVSRNFPELNPLASGETLSVHLWYVKSVAIIPDANEVASGTALVLIIIVLLFNAAINIFSKRIRRKFWGELS